MQILGIDYGNAHVGIAVATGSLAEPLITLRTGEAIERLTKLVQDLAIEEIVIGDCAVDFLVQLESLGIPVHSVDETLSSHDARQALLHTTKKRRRDNEHSVAAAVILQNWLDSGIQNS